MILSCVKFFDTLLVVYVSCFFLNKFIFKFNLVQWRKIIYFPNNCRLISNRPLAFMSVSDKRIILNDSRQPVALSFINCMFYHATVNYEQYSNKKKRLWELKLVSFFHIFILSITIFNFFIMINWCYWALTIFKLRM